MTENINLFPLFLSLRVSIVATLISIVIGLPIAYYLARAKGKITDFIDTLTSLPVVLPPTVLGYYLLISLGRQSLVGKFLERKFNIMIVFTPTGAIIAATAIAAPFLIRSAKAAFLEIKEDLLDSARLLGRNEINIFFTIMIPVAWRGIIAGITMTFVRAMGDFGTTLMVAGSIPNKTTTMPIAIYDALMSGDTQLANILVLILTVVSVIVLYIINRLEKRAIKE